MFVDIQNMYYSARALYNQKVNFGNILEQAVSGRQLVRAFAYGITTEEAHEGEFHEALGKQGFEVKTKPLQSFIGGQKKGDWDVGIAMDMLRLEPKIDVGVLVSGDGDFVPLLQFSKERGLRVEVMAFRESTSSALVEAADSFIDFSSDTKRYLIRGKLSSKDSDQTGKSDQANRRRGPGRRLTGSGRGRTMPKILA